MEDIMNDLETLGVNSRAPILSIGAVAMDEENDKLGDTFYRVVDVQSCLRNGAVVDGDTFYWWLKQSESARMALTRNAVHINTALLDFNTYLRHQHEKGKTIRVWGNGAAFDNAILWSAYRAAGIEPYWPFPNDRCYRTLKNEYPQIELVRSGTHHNALDDALSQADHWLAIRRYQRVQAERLATLEQRLGKEQVPPVENSADPKCSICGGAMGNPYSSDPQRARCLDLSCPG